MLISAICHLLSFVHSIQKDMMFSNTPMTVESAANTMNRKNSMPITRPPGILLKIEASVVNRKPAPA